MLTDKRLTNGELDKIDKRLDEIDKLIKCELPDDVLDTLERELHMHIAVLDKSLEANKRAHLKVMK